MELQVGVKALIRNKDGKYLFARSSLLKYPEKESKWDLVGGRIIAGISLLENLRREVREETGLEIIGTPRLVAAQDILKSSDKHVVRLSYVAEASGEVILDKSESMDFKWFDWEEIQGLGEDLDHYLKEILDKIASADLKLS